MTFITNSCFFPPFFSFEDFDVSVCVCRLRKALLNLELELAYIFCLFARTAGTTTTLGGPLHLFGGLATDNLQAECQSFVVGLAN
jgi:hypothetical protein